MQMSKKTLAHAKLETYLSLSSLLETSGCFLGRFLPKLGGIFLVPPFFFGSLHYY
jgi:hypothetical protein